MKCSEIMLLLENEYPTECAEEWDNVGLIVGRSDREVGTLVVALDATEEVVALAVKAKAQMLFTHHPMIFGPIKKINDSDSLGRKLLALAENRISYYAAHTNYDICRMAELNERQLGLKNTEVLMITNENGEPEGIGRVGYLDTPLRYKELAEHVKQAMDVSSVRYFGKDNPLVCRVAVCGGAGKSTVDLAIQKGAEVLITGDIDHHTGIDALEKGLRIIDAGHYGTEHCFIKDAAAGLREAFPELIVIEAGQEEPYTVI